MATGEAWNELMYDSVSQNTSIFECQGSVSYDDIQANGGQPNGCGSFFAYPFYLSFQLVVTFIFLNLFIAIILEGFEESKELEDM